MTTLDDGWNLLDAARSLRRHNFSVAPYHLSAKQIKEATDKMEPRLLCYHDTRERRPQLFKDLGLFILPVKNGKYVILRGEGYIDLPFVKGRTIHYESKLDFKLDTTEVGSSEMQHLDFAYATSLIRSFMEDDSLHLTIRGRKRTPEFSFRAGGHAITSSGVQTEIDAGYEGRNQIVLVEAKNRDAKNVIIRQLYFPFRMWSAHSNKPVRLLLFESVGSTFKFWQYAFTDKDDYNSALLERTAKYRVHE